jgi:hypothetical protein
MPTYSTPTSTSIPFPMFTFNSLLLGFLVLYNSFHLYPNRIFLVICLLVPTHMIKVTFSFELFCLRLQRNTYTSLLIKLSEFSYFMCLVATVVTLIKFLCCLPYKISLKMATITFFFFLKKKKNYHIFFLSDYCSHFTQTPFISLSIVSSLEGIKLKW